MFTFIYLYNYILMYLYTHILMYLYTYILMLYLYLCYTCILLHLFFQVYFSKFLGLQVPGLLQHSSSFGKHSGSSPAFGWAPDWVHFFLHHLSFSLFRTQMRKIHTDEDWSCGKGLKWQRTVVRSFQKLLGNQSRLKDVPCPRWIGRIMLLG